MYSGGTTSIVIMPPLRFLKKMRPSSTASFRATVIWIGYLPRRHRSLACVGEGASGTCSPCTAALELSLWNLPPRPAPLFFRVPTATSRRLQTLPSAFGLLLHRSLACVRREPGEGASGTCNPRTAALGLSLWNLPPRLAPLLFRAPKATSRRLQKLPGAFGLLLHRSQRR